MTQDHINIGPLRPTTGPLAKLGGLAAAQPLGGGSLPNQVAELQQIVRALQDQVYALSQFFDQLVAVPMMIASGDNHQPGVVPDPGSVSGTTKFLREDATFAAVSATALSGIVPVANGGTGTADGSITGTGDLTFTAGGANKTVTLVSSGTGKVVAKPGTDSTTAIQLQNAAGAAVVDVDTTNGRVGVGGTPASLLHLKQASNTLASGLRVERSGGSTSFDAYMGSDDKLYIQSGTFYSTMDTATGNCAFAAAGGKVVVGSPTAGVSVLRVVGLPTSAAGLSTDDIWCDTGAGNVLKKV